MTNKPEKETISDYNDPIEERQIDKFVCDEMSRQIHRYIKGMSGTSAMMQRFESKMQALPIPEREQAIARYIDLNRKAVAGLDFRIVLTRAMANYCDTFDYFLSMLHDEKKFQYYLDRIRGKYIQYHEVFEENGKFGMRDHHGRILVHPLFDFLRTPYIYVDDLRTMPVIAEKEGKMGLILPDGNETEMAPFAYDDISLRDEPPYFEATKDGKVYFLVD